MLEGHPGMGVLRSGYLQVLRVGLGDTAVLQGVLHSHQVTLGGVSIGCDGCGTALLPPGTQGRGWSHCQGAGTAPAESQVCGTWVVVVSYPYTPVVGTHGELQDPVRDPQKADLWGDIRLEAFLE